MTKLKALLASGSRKLSWRYSSKSPIADLAKKHVFGILSRVTESDFQPFDKARDRFFLQAKHRNIATKQHYIEPNDHVLREAGDLV